MRMIVATLALCSACALGQEAASDPLEKAKALFSQNKRREARLALEALCRASDAPAEAHSLLGMVLIDPPFKDPRRAYESLGRALERDENDLYGNYGMGVLYNRKGESPLALPYLRRALDGAPGYKDCRHELGVAYYQLALFDAATAELRQTTSLPQSVEYLALIAGRRQRHAEAADLVGILLSKMGETWSERPRLQYQKAAFLIMAAQPEPARPLLERAVAGGFARAEALNELARLHYEAGDPARALELYRRATTAESIHRGKPYRQARARARAHFNVGVILYNRGEYKPADTALRSALELERFHENAWYKFGQCCRKLGQKDESKAAFERHKAIQPMAQKVRSARLSLPNNPNDYKSRFELARLLEALDRFDEAIATLRILEHKKADYPGLYPKIAAICRKAGREKLAEIYDAKITKRSDPSEEK